MTFIKKNWWKVLAVVLLLYTFIFALYVPLSPRINRVTNINLIEKGFIRSLDSLSTGNNRVILTGYNTNFTKNEPINIGLEFEKKTYVCATNIKVLNPNQISCEFDIPKFLPSKFLHLRINTPKFSSSSENLIEAYRSDTIRDFKIYENKNIVIQNKTRYFPHQKILYETIRNLMFHVPMWFVMMFILIISFVNSLKYLNKFDLKYDTIAKEAVNIGLLFAFLGLITGSIWSKFTWSGNDIIEDFKLFTTQGWWVNDPKQVGAAITTLIYLAYRILRNSIDDEHQKAKISAVYNIFAFILMILFLIIYPKIKGGLHPGSGENDTFTSYDLDNTLRMVFYPAIIGWILLSLWMLNLKKRYIKLENKLHNEE